MHAGASAGVEQQGAALSAAPEKPWRKAKAQRNGAAASGKDKDGGGQIHADPAKLALLLE